MQEKEDLIKKWMDAFVANGCADRDPWLINPVKEKIGITRQNIPIKVIDESGNPIKCGVVDKAVERVCTCPAENFSFNGRGCTCGGK